MVPQWDDIDRLIGDLGSIRVVVNEAEAQADLHDADIVVELRRSLDRATDVVHLVIGGGAAVSDAWRIVREAQDVADRAIMAVARSRQLQDRSKKLRAVVKERARAVSGSIHDLREMEERQKRARRLPPPREGPLIPR